MTVAVITAIYDNYDDLKPIYSQSVDVEWICVTDDVRTRKELNGWKTYYEPRPWLQPRRAAKTPKCLPWLYTSAYSSIWVDASYQITSSTFVEDVLDIANPIAQFKHPWRNCCYKEAEECARIPKDDPNILYDQIWNLRNIKEHPNNWGLWATGIIARHHTDDVIRMGFEWLAEIYTYSSRDQVSQPDALRRNGLRPVELPGTHLDNQWVKYKGSARH